MYHEPGHLLPPAKIKGRPEQLVDEDFEWLAGPAGFSLRSRGNIIIQRERGAHILMLRQMHQDVSMTLPRR